MKQIPLTKGKFALVDDSDYDELSKYKWLVMTGRNKLYAVRAVCVEHDVLTGTQIQEWHYMARELVNCSKDLEVDHRNGDTLDNQRKNLRICTHSENCRNRKSQANSSSIYKGVSWNKQSKKWHACIRIEDCFGQTFSKHLGYFANEIEAAKVYDKAASHYHEEFAYLNFPLVEDTHEII